LIFKQKDNPFFLQKWIGVSARNKKIKQKNKSTHKKNELPIDNSQLVIRSFRIFFYSFT